MITRIDYANADHTRTAMIRRQTDGWYVICGDRAREDARAKYTRTMTEAQAQARQWCETPEAAR